MAGGSTIAEAERRGPEAARPTLRGLPGRWRQRRRAARELRSLQRYAGRPLIGLTLLVHLLAGLMPVAFMVGVGIALQQLAQGDPVGPWLAVAGAAFVLQQALSPLQLILSAEVARRVDTACITRFTSFALHRTELRTLERPEVADRLTQVDEAFEQWALTPGTAVEGALALVARYTQLVGALVVLLVAVGPWPAVAGAAVALVARTGQTEAFFRWGQLIRGFQPLRRRVAYLRELATSTRAAKEIRTLGLLDWLDGRYSGATRDLLDPLWRWRRRVYGAPFVGYALVALAGTVVALVLLVRSDAAAADRDELGAVVMAAQAIVLCARFGVMFPESDVKLVYGRSAWEALLEFEGIAQGTDQPSAAGADQPSAAGADRQSAGGLSGSGGRVVPQRLIALREVSFGYQPGRGVLAGLSLELPVGSSTALVGVNGAGKTTLVKLLAGLYQPDAGSIEVDGVSLRDLDRAAWLRAFAVTFQDYQRYEMSLRENVAMGAIAHRGDDEGIRAELARVGLGELLAELPDGLETPLTRALPDGRELSGGQWQRLALARSLFAVRHGASVLVLDEPTAQLDARGEAEFYDDFLELTRGVTSLVISHRFSSVRRADRIVVLDGGRVTESGSHDELVALGGTYARMFEVQARRFAAEGAGLSGALSGTEGVSEVQP